MNELIPLLQELIGLDQHKAVEFVTNWGGPLGSWIVLQLMMIFVGVSAGLKLALIATIAFVTNSWLKWIIAEPRPFHTDSEIVAFGAVGDFGMPSGHAQGAAAFWGGLAWMWRSKRWLFIALVLFALTVGLTRVYLGAHSPAQVLVGLALGFVVAYVVLVTWPKLTERLSLVSWDMRWLLLAGVSMAALLVSEIILALNAGFVVPEAWIEGYMRAEGVDGATAEDLSLFTNSSLLIVGMGSGFGALALLHERWSCAIETLSQKWLAFGAAVVINLVLIVGLGISLGSDLAVLVFAIALLQPVLVLYLPMRLLHRRKERES